MSQSLSLRLSPSLELSQGLLLTQKIELSQQLARAIEGIRGKNPQQDPRNILGALLANLIRGLRSDLSAAFQAVFTEALQESMIKNIEVLAVPTGRKLEDFFLHYLFKASTDSQGRFIHATNPEGGFVADVPQTSFADLSRAFFEPAKMAEEIAAIRSTLELQVQGGRQNVSFQGLHSLEDASRVAPSFEPAVASLTKAVQLLLVQKDETGRYILKDFALDCAVLEKLDIVLSERLQRRFVKRFMGIRPGSKRHDFQIRLLNSIAELSLISLGIISPEMFTVRRGEVDEEFLRVLDDKIECAGMSLIQAFKYYRLRTEGGFFWSRYSTLHVRPSPLTQDLIQGFITVTVRKDEKRILASIDFETFFNAAVSAAATDDEEGPEAALRQVFIDLVEGERFQEQFVKLLKGWYKYLYIFYPQSKGGM